MAKMKEMNPALIALNTRMVAEMVLDTTLPTPVVRKSHKFFASSAQLIDRFSSRLVISG